MVHSRSLIFVAALCVANVHDDASACTASSARNGDINGDHEIDISDPVALLSWLFSGGLEPVSAACPAGQPDLQNGDANADHAIDVSDAIYLLFWLFAGGDAPAEIPCDHELSECETLLCSLGISWSRGPDSPGVAAPVTVTVPIAGIRFTSLGVGHPRESFFMDCSLAVALHDAAEVLSRHGVTEVIDLGIYNYRCIGGGTPPDCPQGVSMHAYAQALDIAALVTDDGSVHSVLEDWVIDPAAEDTCAAETESEKDEFLHAVACDLYDSGVFNIILTPNYNEDHRNHLHVDLTPGVRFIR